jgi:hypothetical protein
VDHAVEVGVVDPVAHRNKGSEQRPLPGLRRVAGRAPRVEGNALDVLHHHGDRPVQKRPGLIHRHKIRVSEQRGDLRLPFRTQALTRPTRHATKRAS